MRSVELSLSDERARALAAEADLLDFEDLETYLTWVLERRFALDVEGSRGDRFCEFADRVTQRNGDSQARDALATAKALARDRTVEGDLSPAVERVEDDALGADADALASVEANRFDEIVSRAVDQTRDRLGDGVDTGIDYSSRRRLDDDAVPGSEITDLSAIEVPGWEEPVVHERRKAVGAALAFLRDAEEAKRNDFVDELFEEYPAGYESHHGWWECIKRGLRQVDRVDPAREGSRIWRYRNTPGRVRRISYS